MQNIQREVAFEPVLVSILLFKMRYSNPCDLEKMEDKERH